MQNGPQKPVAEYEISISGAISEDLALRDIADMLFDELDQRPEGRIIVDFTGVKTISRCFAHEYQVRKKGSSKTLLEVNVPYNVSNMFIAAMDYNKKLKFPGLAEEPFIQL